MNTDLSLEVSSATNTKIMRLYDTSHYHDDEVVHNYLIEVLPVNKTTWLTYNVAKYFTLVLNSSNLRYKKVTDSADLIELPDGIYEIKQSYKPNSKTVIHFYHFRITSTSNSLQSERNKLYNDKCNISRDEFFVNRDKLRDIEEYLYAAKWMVEECHDKVKGKELFEYAKKLLERYANECQC